MEKLMVLSAVSEKKQREIKRQDGSVKMLAYREVTMTDGVDTIHGETSESLTAQIDSDNPAIKIRMIEGHLYNVRFNIRTATYEKDGKKSLFVLPGADKAVYLSARNLERANVMAASALNTYRVLDADVLVLTESALGVVGDNLNK